MPLPFDWLPLPLDWLAVTSLGGLGTGGDVTVICWFNLEPLFGFIARIARGSIWAQEKLQLGFLLQVEAIVATFLRHQFVMGTLFDYCSFIHHQNDVGVANGGKAMGDEKDGAPLKGLSEI